MAPATAAALEEPERVEIRPQPGPQTEFLQSEADIAIFGGAAGGGKTYALLMEPSRHLGNKNAGAVFFRRTYPQIRAEGGLWDEAEKMYPAFGGRSNQTELSYSFGSGMTVTFAHLQHEKDKESWKGAQIPLILFDQLEDFTEGQFWYLQSRNRSATAGFSPYVRATCNPVPADDPTGGWLNRLIAWWIDQKTGLPIRKRSGVVRWFIRVDDEIKWGPTRASLHRKYPDHPARSLTFIPAGLEDNPILEQADPHYRANLMALPRFERERLLGGNWLVQPDAGMVFDRGDFKTIGALPGGITDWVRYWDKAGTEGGDGAESAAVLLGRFPVGTVPTEDGGEEILFNYIVADVTSGRWSFLKRERAMRQVAAADARRGAPVVIWIEQEPGSGGKESAQASVMRLGKHEIHIDRVTGSKLARAGPFSGQVEAGNVWLLEADWNEGYLAQHHRFDGKTGLMDRVDASTGAYNQLLLQEPGLGGPVALW